MSRSSSKLGHVGSETRLLGQILEKPCVHSKRHSFDPKFMKLIRMLVIIISRSGSKLGTVRSKTSLLGQILEKPFIHSRSAQFCFKCHETLSECESS